MTGASKEEDSRMTAPVRVSTIATKAVGSGVVVWVGVSVSLGEVVGVRVGELVFVGGGVVAVNEDLVGAATVSEGAIVDVAVGAGTIFAAVNPGITGRFKSKPPRMSKAGSRRNNQPAGLFGVKPRAKKVTVASKMTRPRWVKLTSSAPGNSTDTPKGKPKPAMARGKRTSYARRTPINRGSIPLRTIIKAPRMALIPTMARSNQ